MLPYIARFPEIVIGPVLHNFVPERDVAFEILGVGVGQRTHVQKELVAVGRAVLEVVIEFLGRLRPGPAEIRHEVENVRQKQSSVVMPIVADKPIGHRRLRRGRLQSRMRVDHAGIRVEAGIRDTGHAHLAVMTRHVLDKPIDGVEGVRSLIHILRSIFARNIGSHVDILPFGHPPTAHVLVNEDVSFLAEQGRRP